MRYILFICYYRDPSDEVAQILVDRGHEVLHAGNGLEALQIIHDRGEPPVAIFSHLGMPEMDGFEFVMAFKRKFPGAETQILLSTNRISHVLFHDWKLPVDNFIMEPYTKLQLLFSVEQLLYRRIVRL